MADDHQFSTSAMKRLIKTETDKRVGEEAANLLGVQMNDYGVEVAEKALEVAHDDGRKTVRANDIRAAVRQLD